MITHFYSDPHFGHANIIKLAERPFATVEEMDAELEARYRQAVNERDIVLWCGDTSFRGMEWTAALLARLPGRKLLLRGNHDETVSVCLRMGFELVAEQLYLHVAGFKVTACHFPPAQATRDDRFTDRRPPKPGLDAFVLHGHTHERERLIGRRIHVGVDAWDFAPAPFAAVETLVRRAMGRQHAESLAPFKPTTEPKG